MKPINLGGHAAYQDHVLELMRKYYPDPGTIPPSTWMIIDRFWHLDLSHVDEQMADRYSIFGPAPRLPSCMLRSFMLSIEFKVTSFTEWSRQLRINPLFAIVSGFSPSDTPGTGTFYDFNARLWLSDSKNLSPHERQSKAKVKKPSKMSSFRDLRSSLPLRIRLSAGFSTYSRIISLMSLLKRVWLISILWLSPVMVLLSLLQQENGANGLATAARMESLTAAVIATTLSLTATLDGIHPETASTTATTCTC